MRAFHLRAATRTAVAAVLACASPAVGQYPGELLGRVIDATTGLPVADALIVLPASQRVGHSDGSGEFHLRALDPGDQAIRIEHLGYATLVGEIRIWNGSIARNTYLLQPAPISVDSLAVQVDGLRSVGVHRIVRAEIRRSGARTAGDVLATAPAVVIRREGVAGAQTASIRGSSADAVLVLLDGAPLNDPITGEADLSRVAASAIQEIRVVAGGATSRFGPGAEGGVILIRTADAPTAFGVRVGVGSLGRFEVSGEGGLEVGKARLGLGVEGLRTDGTFSFTQAPEVGGVDALRRNADERHLAAWTILSLRGEESETRFRLGVESVHRGLPGKEFAPSAFARQEAVRARGSAAWSGRLGGSRADVAGYVHLDGSAYRDPEPPLGLPFDTRTRVTTAGARGDVSWEPGIDWLSEMSVGALASLQRVNSGALSASAPRSREAVSVSARGSLAPPGRRTKIELTAAGHWDGLAGRWRGTHDVTVSFGEPGLSFHAAQRSSFSLPTLGDQFFSEGVAVAPNPDLRAERVPWELEAGIEMRGGRGKFVLAGGASAYRGDVIDMIVWAPDFRFVWGPRNVDVNRWGLDAWGEVTRSLSSGVLRASANYSMTKVTYDRPDPVPVQVMYRPRHSGAALLGLTAGSWDGQVGVKLTGARFPVASLVNELPAFWATELRLARRGRLAGREYRAVAQVDRLFDRKDTLIFGYPHPGRTLSMTVVLGGGDGD